MYSILSKILVLVQRVAYRQRYTRSDGVWLKFIETVGNYTLSILELHSKHYPLSEQPDIDPLVCRRMYGHLVDSHWSVFSVSDVEMGSDWRSVLRARIYCRSWTGVRMSTHSVVSYYHVVLCNICENRPCHTQNTRHSEGWKIGW